MKVFVAILFLFYSLFSLQDSFSAPCCASAGGVSGLILGDEKAQVSLSYTRGSVIGEARADQSYVFRSSNAPSEIRESYTLSAASLIDQDRLQIGFTLPLQTTSMENTGRSQTGLGDLQINVAYETLPEWNYGLFPPRVFSFFQLTLPTGLSLYEASDPRAQDAQSLGQTQMSLGSIALKNYGDFDGSLLLRGTHLFGSSFQGPVFGSTTIDSNVGFLAALGFGYQIQDRLRCGLNLAYDYRSGYLGESDGFQINAESRYVWNTGVNVSALLGEHTTLMASYTDQTLLGPAKNASLSRTFAMSYIYRVER